MNIHDVFNSLKGAWKLSRTINDNDVMHGSAQFTQINSDVLFYRESGIFTGSNQQALNVYREYVYCYRENTIYVFFPEGDQLGSLLHKLNFITTENETLPVEAVACHACKNDIYHAKYLFFDNRIYLQYKVNGSDKNYTINTSFLKSEI